MESRWGFLTPSAKPGDEILTFPLQLPNALRGMLWHCRKAGLAKTARKVQLRAETVSLSLCKSYFQYDLGGAEIMLDVIFIVATVIFFAAAILYVRGCERLR